MQIKMKAIIYIAKAPSLSNQRSAKPHNKKERAIKLAAKPVKTIQFGLLPEKQQNSGAIPIYIFYFILFSILIIKFYV